MARAHRRPVTLGTTRGARFEGGDGEYAASAPLDADGMCACARAGAPSALGSSHVIADSRRPSLLPGSRPRPSMMRSNSPIRPTTITASSPRARSSARMAARASRSSSISNCRGRSAKNVTQTTFSISPPIPMPGSTSMPRSRRATRPVRRPRARPFPSNFRSASSPIRLARALIEQRRISPAWAPTARGEVLRTLDALTSRRTVSMPRQDGAYLACAAAYWGLKYARRPADIERVEDLLWQMAIGLEQGGLLTAAEQLRRLQQTCASAGAGRAAGADRCAAPPLSGGAGALSAGAGAEPAADERAARPNAKVLGAQDLDALLKAIEQLSQSGNREQAAQMLALLQNMLENMQARAARAAAPADKALNDRDRQARRHDGQTARVLDKTFRQRQGTGDPKDGGPQGLARQQSSCNRNSAAVCNEGEASVAGERSGRQRDGRGRQARLEQAICRRRHARRTRSMRCAKALSPGPTRLADAARRGRRRGPARPRGAGRGAGIGGNVRIPTPPISRARARS